LFKIAVLVSGGGSNLQAIIDSIDTGYLNCSIEAVVADREGTYGVERAAKRGIKTYVVDRKTVGSALSSNIINVLGEDIDLVVLAGFLSILSGEFIEKFKNRIINIHPSLVPSFCGMGMHGIKVHEKAVEYGVKVSGCTVHFVDEGADTGPVILQRTVPVFAEDTAKSLQERILVQEHIALPTAVKYISEGRVSVTGRKVFIGGVDND
jgi:phosphoribosylglycinamide formyltransferase-1